MSTESTVQTTAENSNNQQNTVTVVNPEDYNNQRRLQQIHNAREAFPKIRREARDRFNPNDERKTEITQERYYEIVSNALLDYLIELEPIMRDSPHVNDNDEDTDSHPYWDQIKVAEAEDCTPLTIESIVENGGQMPTEDDEDVPLDDIRARKAYRVANRFLATVGLGLQLGNDGLPEQSSFDSTT